MLPRRRLTPAIFVWLSGTALCSAQDITPARPSAWGTLVEGAPILWTGIFIAAIFALAVFIQLLFVLTKGRVSPPALIDSLTRAIQAGNYQETWDTCNRWRQTALARMLQPALERIGQGHAPAESRLAEEFRNESRHVSLLLWGMLGAAIVAAVLCLVGMMGAFRGVPAYAMSPESPRAHTLAMGNAALLGALAVAILIPAVVSWLGLRSRAKVLLQAASEQGAQMIATLPYEEIEGVRIGRDFHAGTILGDPGDAPVSRLQVSRELTTLCPSCNGPINSSRSSCPHCGQLLAWS